MLRFLVLCLATVCLGNLFVESQNIGGVPVKGESFPYQLALEVNGKHTCSAAIIGESLAVTAAHCCSGVSIRDMTLRAGSTYLDTAGNVYRISRKVVHKLYDPTTFDYDIALLQVSTPFVFGAGVSPIALPEQGEDIDDGTLVTASGWPKSKTTGTKAHQLQAFAVPIVGQYNCQRAFNFEDITPRMICAGYRKAAKESCQADPGGPLVYNHKLIGIASWGHECARPQIPVVYTRVPTLRNWIVQGGSSGSLATFSVALQLAVICFHFLFN